MTTESFADVFDALADDPVTAANMTARADLLLQIRDRIRSWDLPGTRRRPAWARTRPRLND